MTTFHLILVALIQGITEFLPISSSGHLILLPALMGSPDQGQIVDVAVHVGTLLAVILYFRQDTARILRGIPKVLSWQVEDQDGWLALCLVVATIPVMLFGLFLNLTGLDVAMRSVTLIGVTMLVFGLVLWWADKGFPQTREAEAWSLRHAAIMGIWQMLALIPGTSRSGITITGARTLGYTREDGARLSMLMSIPTIAASGVLLGAEAVASADGAVLLDAAIAAALSCVAALITLWAMFRLLQVVSFTPYVIYRVILGAVLIWYGLTADTPTALAALSF